MEPPAEWHTETLAPLLWELGRVRDHAYFDCPWWPDLQVSPGQTLFDRTKGLFRTKRKDVTFTADGGVLAQRFVYGQQKWPYFGDEGFKEELGPALRRHPSFEVAPMKIRARAAHLHAFAVDVAPRTPQARRRLTTVSE